LKVSYICRSATEKERGREIRTATEKEREEERSVTHAHRSATEKERGRENVFRLDLSLYPAREILSVGFGRIWSETQMTSPDPARNPDGLARSGRKCRDRKPTYTGVGLTNLALSPVVPISAFRQDPVFMRVVVRPAGVQIEGLSFGRLGFRSRGCTPSLRVNVRCGVQIEGRLGFIFYSFSYQSTSFSFRRV
jgi:hypothetical protein